MDGWRRILVGTDLSPLALKGVQRAATLARSSGARVLIVFVVEKMWFPPLPMASPAPLTFGREGDVLGEAVAYGEAKLKDLVAAHFHGVEGNVETKVALAVGAAAGLLDAADQWHPDVIVIASHGRSGVMHLLLGSTAEKVVRHATTDVLVVR